MKPIVSDLSMKRSITAGDLTLVFNEDFTDRVQVVENKEGVTTALSAPDFLGLALKVTQYHFTKDDPARVQKHLSVCWIPCNQPPPPAFQSSPMDTIQLLLRVPGYHYPQAGRYVGSLEEWFMFGSPRDVNPTHWMPMPADPVF